MSEVPDEAWESDDCVRRTIVLPAVLAERLAAEAEQRGLSVSDLLAEYAEEGLRRDDAGSHGRPLPDGACRRWHLSRPRRAGRGAG